jgi:signal transduction histidine kinase
MGSIGPISLGFLLIAAGIAVLAASYRISRLARSYRQRMEQLLQLANQAMDPLDIPAAAWPALADGGWHLLSWEGSWFGQPVSGEMKAPVSDHKNLPPALVFNLGSGEDVRLQLRLTHTKAWGEDRLFAEPLARVFVLLIETRLHAQTEALAAALAERARLSLYLQHDMRNLAQWVIWVSGDFICSDNNEALLSAGRRLRENAPLAQERAERLINALGQHPTAEIPARLALAEAVRKAARLAGIEPTLSGEAHAWIAPGQLARVLDNLFSNLAAGWRIPTPVSPIIDLEMIGSGAEMRFLSPWVPGMEPIPAAKLFEPFASGRAGGLGLGLYQARKTLREAGGDLAAEVLSEGLRFRLRLRAEAP